MDAAILFLSNLFLQPLYRVILDLLMLGGWTVVAYLLIYAGLEIEKIYKREKYTSTWEWVLLAIDIPALNIQTPKAVEQLFSHIFSIWEPPSITTMFRRGYNEEFYSFEIISIEGYIQFLVRVRVKYRDVLEAAVYAQYPEAEIIEVEDYVSGIPTKYPNDTHDIWAADYVLTKHWAFPLRLYRDFEHSISKDAVLKDPMGTLLESFTRIGPGEQVWFQIIIAPIAEKLWKDEAIEKIKEMVGEKKESGKSFLTWIFDNTLTREISKGFAEINAQLSGGAGPGEDAGASKDSHEPKNQILYLTPGERKIVEAMEDKISKIGFRTKIRMIYVAKKEAYKPNKAINSITGALNQFNVPYCNMLLPKYMTSVEYMFAEARKNYRRSVLMHAYQERAIERGKEPFVLNIEELATIWHFPMSHVKTPLLQKAEGKHVEPPAGLPLDISSVVPETSAPPQPAMPESESPNTPDEKGKKKYVTDSGDVWYVDDANLG